MNQHRGKLNGSPLTMARTFTQVSRAEFASSYPEDAHKLHHELKDHPLLELDALASLGALLPDQSVEYNRGDLPIGVDGKPEPNGLTIEETIRNIASTNSWAVLKNIEQVEPYKALLGNLLGELEDIITAKTGQMLKTQGFIFISSPDAVTPYHFDPEHNILLQLRGSKVMTVFPAGDPRFAPDRLHETYHTGGGRELRWQDAFENHGMPFALNPDDAIYVPVMAPHFVRNGPEPSISLSITWRSEWSFSEADARAFNGVLRRLGVNPRPPERWPSRNRGKALGWRILRRIPGIY